MGTVRDLVKMHREDLNVTKIGTALVVQVKDDN